MVIHRPNCARDPFRNREEDSTTALHPSMRAKLDRYRAGTLSINSGSRGGLKVRFQAAGGKDALMPLGLFDAGGRRVGAVSIGTGSPFN